MTTDLKIQFEDLRKGMETILKLIKELFADEEFYESKVSLRVDKDIDYYQCHDKYDVEVFLQEQGEYSNVCRLPMPTPANDNNQECSKCNTIGVLPSIGERYPTRKTLVSDWDRTPVHSSQGLGCEISSTVANGEFLVSTLGEEFPVGSWETKPVARNPYTRQWFDMKNVIPQIELRQEMEQYIKLRKVPTNCQAEIDVIADYTKDLEEGMMKQLLNELRTSVTSERWTDRKQYWETIWKKINLVRLYCQSHNANIQTFRSLRGYQYFDKIVAKANLYLSFRSCSKDHNEAGLMDICKELVRTVDTIGLISSNITGENSMGFNIISGLISILGRVYLHTDGYMKMQTAVLRIYCKIFNKVGAHIVKVVGHEFYVNALKTDVLITAIDKLTVMKAPEIIGEDLNHGISILRRAWIKDKNVMHHINYARSLVDAVFLCRCREIEIPDEKDINEGEMVEARVQRSHNSAALENGLTLMK